MIRDLLGLVAGRFLFRRNALRCHLYLRKGRVFVPTLGRVPGGPYRDIEPVTVVEVSDTDGLRRAFRQTIARGNPPVGPYPRPNPPPVVLKHAGVKSWGAFARGRRPGLSKNGTANIKSSDIGGSQTTGYKIRSRWSISHLERHWIKQSTT
jgi:hypothetical protein